MKTTWTAVILLCTVGAFAQPAPAPANNARDLFDEQIQNAIRTKGITNRGLIAILIGNVEAAAPSVSRSINRARTDLQSGTPSDAPRSTSVLEKPGIPDLLSMAIDRGAITKTAAGTGLTLSTTPYAIGTGFGARDTPTRFDQARFARSLSISSTFSSTDVTNGDFSSFTSAQVKYAALGNRSPRDGRLLDSVREEMANSFLAADQKLVATCAPVMNHQTFIDAFDQINRDLAALASTPTKADVLRIVNLQLAKIDLKPTVLEPCFAVVRAEQGTSDPTLEILKKATAAYLKNNPHQLSFAGLFVRDPATSDYYTGKVLYAYTMVKMTANLNASISWNRHDATTAGAQLRKLREYSIETGANTPTLANVDYSASAKWSRDKAADAKSAIVGEGKASIHISDMFQLPVSLTFCNRETDKLKKGWQLNFGFSALLDDVLREVRKR